MPSTRDFLRDSTSDKRVVPYSRLLSTDLSTVSTVVNTVKELTRFRRDPITRRCGTVDATAKPVDESQVVGKCSSVGLAWEALQWQGRAHRVIPPAMRRSENDEEHP
jgi:hypothetical protein